jgi:hypothetical protein
MVRVDWRSFLRVRVRYRDGSRYSVSLVESKALTWREVKLSMVSLAIVVFAGVYQSRTLGESTQMYDTTIINEGIPATTFLENGHMKYRSSITAVQFVLVTGPGHADQLSYFLPHERFAPTGSDTRSTVSPSAICGALCSCSSPRVGKERVSSCSFGPLVAYPRFMLTELAENLPEALPIGVIYRCTL